MEHTTGKHVKIICDLNIGDYVTTSIAGYKTKRVTQITGIKYEPNSESGFFVKTENYDKWHDSNWITKLT